MDNHADLPSAIDRLKAFRTGWDAGEVIDEASRLTADDLDAIIAQVEFDLIT